MRDEVVGPAGPTTATRMDKFTEMMLGQTGLIAMIGKAERGPAAIEAIRKHRSAYLMARRRRGLPRLEGDQAGQASSPSPTSAWKRSTSSTCVDMPVTVAVDANGTSVHDTGPRRMEGAHRRHPGRRRLRSVRAAGQWRATVVLPASPQQANRGIAGALR